MMKPVYIPPLKKSMIIFLEEAADVHRLEMTYVRDKYLERRF